MGMTPTILPRRGALACVILLSGCLLLAACGGGVSSGLAATGPARHGTAGSAAGGSGTAEGRPAIPSAGSAAGSTAGGQPAAATAGLAAASQSVVYTASLTVRAVNVTTTAQRAVAIALAAGGYVADEHARSGPFGKTGKTIELTLKIPVPAYETALGKLSSPALGRQIAMRQQATDVTQQVADVNSLVSSQEAAIKALQGLLSRAGSVSGLLAVQQQISSDSSTLNSLLAQQRALDHETAYATVTMSLLGPKPKVVPHRKTPPRHSFLTGLSAGWRALRRATDWLLTAVGAALPFVVIVLLLAGLGWAARRRVRRRTGPTAAG